MTLEIKQLLLVFTVLAGLVLLSLSAECHLHKQKMCKQLCLSYASNAA